MSFDRKSHWENVYTNKTPAEVSWYQLEPAVSLRLIASTGVNRAGKIIDVGGGASVLVDKLLDQGFGDLTVLDVSSKALDYAKKRLGNRAGAVKWIEADIAEFESSEKYDLWHDRAVFHFLTDEDDREKYVQNMKRALNPGGHVIIAAFSIDGPLKCSGLDVERYSPEKINNALGNAFEFVQSVNEGHMTPGGKEQKFTYCYFRKVAD
ncbi:MAG: class I SAM-dependent methyltransferase [Candidatus Omnitrophota bacterium]|nr:class I SAM-dependent methyltransferase [Candidatus Omnitrophota bacterium]